MSAAHRFKSCACCGKSISENDRVSVEPLILIGFPVVYIPVLWGHSSFGPAKRGEANVERRGLSGD